MTIDLDKLSADERQSLANQLHQAAVYPHRLVGMGTPAHIESINANLNDLRNMVTVQAVNMQRFYEIIAPRMPAALPLKTEPKKEKESPDDA